MGSLPVLTPAVAPRIGSLLIKPASALCNLDCAYCFYLDRELDPYKDLPARKMSDDTMRHLVESFLFYSYPNSVFAFQGGEPTLVGAEFFEKLCDLQQRKGRDGQQVSNALQTNAMLIDERWCRLFRAYNWLLGVSIDGPQEMHDLYRFNKAGHGTWKRVMQSIELLQKHDCEFNVLCVLSQANVSKPREVYKFYRSLGVEYMQFIPLSEFDAQGNPLPFTITPEEYGRFLTEVFDLWWPERRKIRIRLFDNIAESLAGMKPGNCMMHDSCDSYAVVEYNGDVYPCDFFVEGDWKLGNIHEQSWPEIARRQTRYAFAANKSRPHPECQVCEYAAICKAGCPKHRHDRHKRFDDLDYFCQSYKMIFGKAVEPLGKDVQKILARQQHPPMAPSLR